MAQDIGLNKFEEEIEQIEKRRWQLWSLAFLLIIVFSLVIAILSNLNTPVPGYISKLLNYNIIRTSLPILTLAFCAYLIEREIILKKKSRQVLKSQVKALSLDEKVKQVSAMYQAGKALNSVLDLNKVLDVILTSAFNLLGASQGSIMLVNKAGYLQIVNSYGLSDEIKMKTRVKPGEGIAGKVLKNKKPILLQGKVDSTKFHKFVAKDRPIKSSMCVPLLVRNEAIGTLSVTLLEGQEEFNDYDLNMLEIFAEQAAAAIYNSQLFEERKVATENLSQLNNELKNKNITLKDYNKDLKRINDELERFNRLIVGRELMMIKLKKRIAKLESVNGN